MSSSGAKPFDNNWAYLKTELRWLDRLLMLAVSRQRQDDKTVNAVAHTPADKVTSHWWKGIIAVSHGIDDREGPPPRSSLKATNHVSYSQHLENRIRASHQAGVVLALPELRHHFSLTEVEKNILLLAIAPEINRRYGRLYDYLQDDAGTTADLPTVDLCLRLLCRNDHDWQLTRARLTAPDSLFNRGLVEWIGDEDGTLLGQQIRVANPVTNYLLADMPNRAMLRGILTTESTDDTALASGPCPGQLEATAMNTEPDTSGQSAGDAPNPAILTQEVTAPWEQLILPQTVLHQLQYLSQQATQRQRRTDIAGLMVLLVGASGTGKTIATGTLAAHAEMPLTCIDLETLSPEDYPSILTDAPTELPSLLLIKQGEQWFGRQPQVDQVWLHQWWQWRQQLYGLTLVAVRSLTAIRPRWRQKFDSILTLPHPDTKARRRLWEQSLSPSLKTSNLDWGAIAKQLSLTGGEIHAIAQTIQADLQAQGKSVVTLGALKQALKLHLPHVDLRSLKGK